MLAISAHDVVRRPGISAGGRYVQRAERVVLHAEPLRRCEAVGLRGGCGPPLVRPDIEIVSSIAHPVSEAMEGRAGTGQAVAIKGWGREAKISDCAPGVEEFALDLAHAVPLSALGHGVSSAGRARTVGDDRGRVRSDRNAAIRRAQ